MKERLNSILSEGKKKIEQAKTLAELQDVKASILGKQGSLAEIFKEIPKLDISLRPEIGRLAFNLKEKLTSIIDSRRE